MHKGSTKERQRHIKEEANEVVQQKMTLLLHTQVTILEIVGLSETIKKGKNTLYQFQLMENHHNDLEDLLDDKAKSSIPNHYYCHI